MLGFRAGARPASTWLHGRRKRKVYMRRVCAARNRPYPAVLTGQCISNKGDPLTHDIAVSWLRLTTRLARFFEVVVALDPFFGKLIGLLFHTPLSKDEIRRNGDGKIAQDV